MIIVFSLPYNALSPSKNLALIFQFLIVFGISIVV